MDLVLRGERQRVDLAMADLFLVLRDALRIAGEHEVAHFRGIDKASEMDGVLFVPEDHGDIPPLRRQDHLLQRVELIQP